MTPEAVKPARDWFDSPEVTRAIVRFIGKDVPLGEFEYKSSSEADVAVEAIRRALRKAVHRVVEDDIASLLPPREPKP